jgi:Protein of unknown function (DUF3632)
MDSPDDLSDLWQARFGEVVGGYLRSGGGMPPEVGAAAFAGVIDGAWAHRGPGRYDIEEALWPAWQAVISAADTLDDAARARLVAPLRALRDRGLQARADGHEYVVWGRPVVSGELPLFGPQLRENWNDAPPARSPISWANLNAFAAQLTAGGIDFSLYASWALRDALEDDEPELSQVLPAAVQWLRLAGALLASLARKGRHQRRASEPAGPPVPAGRPNGRGIHDPALGLLAGPAGGDRGRGRGGRGPGPAGPALPARSRRRPRTRASGRPPHPT